MPDFINEFLLRFGVDELNIVAIGLIVGAFFAAAIMFHMREQYQQNQTAMSIALAFCFSIISAILLLAGFTILHWTFDIRPELL